MARFMRAMVNQRRIAPPARWFLAFVFGLPALSEAAVVEQALEVTLRPAEPYMAVRNHLTLPERFPERATFELHAGFRVSLDGPPGARLEPLRDANPQAYRRYVLTLPPGERRVTLRYVWQLVPIIRADLPAPGLITDVGVYLDDESRWYPVFGDELVRLRLTVELPAGWKAVSQGRRVAETSDAHGYRVTWEEQQPQEAIYLIAARFHEYRAPTPWGEALVLLRQPDEHLAQIYLDATREYLDRYSRLLGPYPYAKFALVENFRETGVAMPSFTLLGPNVIRLPFMPKISYAHEVLHSWWGNGVYVDVAGGNWAEGLTTYLADHFAAEHDGQGAAHRRDALQRYVSFVTEGHDFALRDFRVRHDQAGQAVGYGKALMLFHMLRLELGDETFIEGLRAFYRQHRFRRAGFEDLRAAMERASGRPLAEFFQQWVERVGAPRLALADVMVNIEGGHYRVRGLIEQTQPGAVYHLRVPIVLELEGGGLYETTLLMSRRRLRLDIALDERPRRLAVDPRFDLFREPDPDELPPSFGEALGAPSMTVVLPAAAPREVRAAFEMLARRWERPGLEIRRDDELAALPEQGSVWLLGWENRFRPLFEAALSGRGLASEAVVLDEKRFVRGTTYSVALAARRDGQALAWIGAEDTTAIANVARRLPRYQRASYVVFRGIWAEKELDGQWEVEQSPLIVPLAPGAHVAPFRPPPRPPLSPPGRENRQ